MIFGSVCSGIEAASAAWEPLGWRSAFFSEIEPFPCAVLAHHYPNTPNHGDMTKYEAWPDAALDVLVGGTPCQSFSVAGLRKGLRDPRGNLMLTFGAIAARYRPRWLVWENVPGVLSSDGGRDFGTFLGMLAELGYGFAYRVLDAQFAGVPQRRRRVFVVGCLGDWRRAAAVLLERASLRGDPAPRREAREGIAGTLTTGASDSGGWRAGADEAAASHLIPDVSMCLNAGAMGRQDAESETLIAHALRADGFDASEDGTGRGTPIVADTLRGHPRPGSNSVGAIAFDARQSDVIQYGDKTGQLDTDPGSIAIAFAENSRAEVRLEGGDGSRAGSLSAGGGKPGQGVPMAATTTGVRRLTPRECERLQGFPDDYTLIPVRGKPAADSPRYKALGNSMAVPVMRWIGERIAMVDAICAAA